MRMSTTDILHLYFSAPVSLPRPPYELDSHVLPELRDQISGPYKRQGVEAGFWLDISESLREEGERTGRNPAGGRRQKHNHRILSKVWTGLRANSGQAPEENRCGPRPWGTRGQRRELANWNPKKAFVGEKVQKKPATVGSVQLRRCWSRGFHSTLS